MSEEKSKKKGKAEKGTSKGQAKKEPKGKGAKQKREPHPPARLFLKYKSDVMGALRKQFEFKSVMEVPRIDKVVLNMGVGNATQDPKLLEDAVADLKNISGQQPSICKSKKAISNFKLRKGQSIGCRVTLRRNMMYEFFDRLVSVALPRVRDFRGLSTKSFDGHGNYSLGIKEQIIFNEINHDKVSRIMGLDVTICTSAKTDEEGKALLERMGMPFRKP